MSNGNLVYLTNTRYGVTHIILAICSRHDYLMGSLDSHVGSVPPANDGSLTCVYCTNRRVLVNVSEADGVSFPYYNGR